MAGHPMPANAHEVHTAHGDVRMRGDGHPMDVHDARRGIDVHNNLGGGRRIMMDRPGGGRMYYERGRPGYIGHPYRAHGYELERRAYFDHGRAYNRFYRPYPYHGYVLDVYVPGRYYPPAFYGWAYQPWRAPVRYAWGFGSAPWYGYYGAYYTPYPVYSSPSLWLTDYMLSESLAGAYAAQQDAGSPPPPPYAGPPLAPDVKQMISDEVQRDLALENAEAQANAQQQAPDPSSSGIARLMSDGQPHVFVASREVDVTDSNGRECAVTDGDVVLVRNSPGPSDTTAQATVLASKGGNDCARAAQVAVGLDELNEMNNHLRETLDRGLAELQSKQGTGGLPQAPPSARAPDVEAVVAEGAPPPAPAEAKELEQQAQQCNKDVNELAAEASVGSAAPQGDPLAADSGGSTSTETVSVAVGQTAAQVKAAMGPPTKIVNLGPKTIYFFGSTKVTLVDGKVKAIE